MRFPRRSGAAAPPTGGRPDRERRRRIGRGAAAALCALAVTMLSATDALAKTSTVTAVTTTNPGKLTAAGPVNSINGFPAWYQDSTGRRIEPCLDKDNPLCGFTPGTIPDTTKPISFPGNFPSELFYQLISSNLTLPNGGKVTLTLSLEGGFASGAPKVNDQQVFNRTRIVVKGGPPNVPLDFTYPFGTATVNTDATGAGKLNEDLTPVLGNFTTPLQGNFGPFLTWDTGTIKDSTGEYAGDPAIAHKITPGLNNVSTFSVANGSTASTDQFTIQGKISTNTGVHADAASVTADGGFVDVFATSAGEQLQVEATGSTPATPMQHDPASDRFYARLPVTGTAPTTVTVTNISDKPVSTSGVAVATPTGLTISKAEFDGTTNKLTVNAASTTAADVLTVTGYGDLTGGAASFDTVAPPATVEVKVKGGTRAVTAPVVVTAGGATTAQPPTPVGQPPAGTAPAAPTGLTSTPGATNVNLSWGAVTGATSYQVVAYAADGVTKLATQPVAVTGSGTTAPATTQNIVGLTAGTTYQFSVTVTTAAGTSPESAKVSTATTADTVTIATAKYKTTDFRVTGTTSATSGSVNVYAVSPVGNPTAQPITGMANVAITSAAPAAGGAFDARLRTGVPAKPANVWVKTSNGAVAGPFPAS